MKTPPPPINVPHPYSPPPTPNKQGLFNRHLLAEMGDLKKMLLLMIQQRSVVPDQGPSMDALGQHLQLTQEEQEEQLRLEKQELELEQERLRQEAVEKLRRDQEQERLRIEQEEQAAQQEQLRLEQERTQRLQLRQKQQEQLDHNRATQATLRVQEQELCVQLSCTMDSPVYGKSHWPAVLEYLSWTAPALAQYLQTGESNMLDPQLTEMLRPFAPNHPSMEEGELPSKRNATKKSTDLTGRVPTTIIGTHSPQETGQGMGGKLGDGGGWRGETSQFGRGLECSKLWTAGSYFPFCMGWTDGRFVHNVAISSFHHVHAPTRLQLTHILDEDLIISDGYLVHLSG